MLTRFFNKLKPSDSQKKKIETFKTIFFVELSDQTLEDIFVTSF